MISLGPSLPRCLGVWVGVTSAGAVVSSAVLADLPPLAHAGFEAWVVALAAGALCLTAAWASLVTAVVCLQVARHHPHAAHPALGAGVPAPVRRLLLQACGVAVAGGLVISPAAATPGSLEHERPTTSTATSTTPATPAAPAAARSRLVAADADRVVVRPGDSLWRIAEAELLRHTGTRPSVADVAAYWPHIHAANRALVGPDPDLVRPGVPLVLPTAMPAPSPQES